MSPTNTIAVYTDYKSPYAFLAKDLSYELEHDLETRVDWLPGSHGSAEGEGEMTVWFPD